MRDLAAQQDNQARDHGNAKRQIGNALGRQGADVAPRPEATHAAVKLPER